MQQRRDPQVLDVVLRELELLRNRDRHVRHAMRMALLVALSGLDVVGQELERRQVRVLHFDEARLPLLDEAADHVAREDQEPGPRHQRQQRVAVESGQHVETLHVLVEEHQGDDEHPRQHRKTPAAIEAGEDHRQIVKAQERKLLVHEGVNRYQAEHEHEHEDLLEVAEHE